MLQVASERHLSDTAFEAKLRNACGCLLHQAGMNKELFERYSDYLLSSFGKTTATRLSTLPDGAFSHDQVTRLLSGNDFDSRFLWHYVKPFIRPVEGAMMA